MPRKNKSKAIQRKNKEEIKGKNQHFGLTVRPAGSTPGAPCAPSDELQLCYGLSPN
ncbi:hypothetical protein KSS87_017087 [Heliosperma pusillum]|nr:hypothetical protein KSS87_017087 [Heliosperma pusillum]